MAEALSDEPGAPYDEGGQSRRLNAAPSRPAGERRRNREEPMSAYDNARDQAYLNRLTGNIAEFAQNYNGAQSKGTVFLFLGGLASQLVRADAAYPATPSSYDLLWIDLWGILSGTAIDLQMAGHEDYLDQFMLPDGAIDSILVQPAPYDGFIQWCETNDIDLFMFGWDWRRSSAAAADFFLNKFLPEFVAGAGTAPLNNFWLIGHSFGGMVVKQIVNQFGNQYVQKMKGAITVATPFYGYGGQLHRFFKGDPDLNFSEGSQGPTVVTEIISSLAAGYELLFLDWPTYNANQYAFAHDPEGYNLTSYPIVDRNSGQPADPYNPVPGKPVGAPPALVRYLPNYGFDWGLLASGHTAAQQIAQPLDPSVAPRFWNIRGVQTSNGQKIAGTVVGQTWLLSPNNFNPTTSADPIGDIPGWGDDTLPAWSTRLLNNPTPQKPNVRTVAADDIDHMEMMNLAEVQTAIAGIMFPGALAVVGAQTLKMKPASRKSLNDFLDLVRGATSASPSRAPSRRQRKAVISQILDQYTLKELRALATRAYLDALKCPSQLSDRPKPRARENPKTKSRKKTSPAKKSG
jgi:pimeloyl-ACP methyl ester carboxylesterase